MSVNFPNRRRFLRHSLTLALGAPWIGGFSVALASAENSAATSKAASRPGPGHRSDAKVAIARCRSYGAEVRSAMDHCFDLLGGLGSLVKNKTVTVKVNLTGSNFSPFLGHPVGETYMTHYATGLALTRALFAAGARRVRLVESTQRNEQLEASLVEAGWDTKALCSLGKVEFENTRNLGAGQRYGHLTVPGGGYMFSAFDFNQSYTDTDVMVSLAKLKNHLTCGVTLALKNLFGITPNSLYGDEAGSEDALAGRLSLHDPRGKKNFHPPGLKTDITSADPTWRVPRITADICAARPIQLAIIDGITAMSGGEGPWSRGGSSIKFTAPGVLIAGLNAVSTDAVGAAVMGYADPRATRGSKPFQICDNHILLAEQAGLGTADLAQIDLRGLKLDEARYSYG